MYGRRIPKAEMFARIDAVDADTCVQWLIASSTTRTLRLQLLVTRSFCLTTTGLGARHTGSVTEEGLRLRAGMDLLSSELIIFSLSLS